MDLKHVTRRQWIKMGIVMALYLLFLIWVRSWLGLIVVPFIFDAYITKKVPWTFWKKSTNPTVRSVMSWVDAIVFALIAVYFVNNFLFQNYQIPSSSLEKSLLVGDFLYVSKVSYGPRVPNTPLSMPLAQHTLPIVNTKSYIEWPQWPYKRVKGFGKVKLNDIVVFNYPAGDTVALNHPQDDYYLLAMRVGRSMYPKPVMMDSLSRDEQNMVLDHYYEAGNKQIRSNPKAFGKVIDRPVDRRENYVKRCVGLPGDTFKIVNKQVFVNGSAIENPEGLQFNYLVQTNGMQIPDNIFRELGISRDDQRMLTREWLPYIMGAGITGNENGELNPVYLLPLTAKMRETLSQNKALVKQLVDAPDYEAYNGYIGVATPTDKTKDMYPARQYTQWDRDNYGPIWIPAKGATLTLTKENIRIYERCIRTYEGNTLDIKADGIYINGQKTETYTFSLDYYWMMGDNRHNSLDSRYWGFVPEDHVVGKPILVWLSLDKDRGWFDGKIRWNRLFKWVH